MMVHFCLILLQKIADNLNQFVHLLFGGDPAGGKADNRMIFIRFFPEGIIDFMFQPLCLLIGEQQKLLIGGRLQIERNSFGKKSFF